MLGWRMVLGPVLIFAVVALFALDARLGETAPVLWLLAVLLSLRSAWELRQLLAVRFTPNLSLVAPLVVAIVSANWLGPILGAAAPNGVAAAWLGAPMLALALAVMTLFASALARYRGPGQNLEDLGAEVLILCYVGVFVSFTVQLRWIDAGALNYLPLGSLVVAVKCGDTCAYFAGRAFGKRKLSPLVSPGKTWAGAVGAVGGAALGSWLWLTFGMSCLTTAVPGPWYWSALYGAILGVVGIVGDLAESLIKRDVGQKDSAPLLPGFGGMLDLLDSVTFAAPAAYLLWLILPLRTV